MGLSPHWRSVLADIKKLDDSLRQFLVRVVCDCGACREIQRTASAQCVGGQASESLRIIEQSLWDKVKARPHRRFGAPCAGAPEDHATGRQWRADCEA
jgi:hypothetical protein